MIRANCRARFTAADFDFIVRTLARSQTDQVSLVDLLSDVETRDSILDHPRLVDAILNHCGQLHISSQFYFYVLARHVLQQGGIGDRKLCDYVASLLETFSHASRMQISDETHHLAEQYISDILIALSRATPEQAFLLRAHIGNYSLFISGIFHENTQHRCRRGGPVETPDSNGITRARVRGDGRRTPGAVHRADRRRDEHDRPPGTGFLVVDVEIGTDAYEISGDR